jgi:3-deoxy-manno-octulosonate cytidylyltransferase (CMP-KDO synthetase)
MVKEMSNKPEFTVVIPARMAATRLPGKMLADLNGQPLICHTVARANESGAQKIVVATDHQDIADALVNSDCEVLLTDPSHPSGSDRLAEVADRLKFDQQHIVVNVQGDEPMIPPRLIDEVAAALASSSSANTVMATAAKVIDSDDALADPNTVKVVVNRHGSALYFSRSTIPYARGERTCDALHHVGIYAYRAHFLNTFTQLEPSSLETCESLEQLRVLDHGYAIQVHQFDYPAGFGIDTQADLDKARAALQGT